MQWSTKKCDPICAPGVHVQPGPGVRPFCHNARDERNLFQEQFVGQPLHRNCLNEGIRDDNFVLAQCRRVALVSRLHIRAQQAANARQLAQKLERQVARGLAQPLLGIAVGR